MVKRYRFVGLALVGLALVGLLAGGVSAQGPYSAQITSALRAFLTQAHTWTALQTFDDLTVTGTCTGCGATGTFTLADAGAVRTDTTSGHTGLIQAYDNDTGPGYVSFGTLTNGNSPTLVFANPAGGGSVQWNGTAVALGYGGTGLSAAADDTALVSTGAAWEAKALPDCTDATGNHLNYTAATNTFSCGTSQAWQTPVNFNLTPATVVVGGATVYITPFGTASSGAYTASTPLAVAGTFTKLYVQADGPPGAGQTFTYTLLVAGNVTNLTCTVSDAAISCNDVAHTAALTAGQSAIIRIVASAGASSRFHFGSALLTP